jgi:hypothetical protein
MRKTNLQTTLPDRGVVANKTKPVPRDPMGIKVRRVFRWQLLEMK